MAFSHLLAREAKIWTASLYGDKPRNLLVIVTTLELKPGGKRYKQDKVNRLNEVAQEWISFNQTKADGYILINRPKDWQPEKSAHPDHSSRSGVANPA